ncbi:MAG: hypothetical protein ACUVRN_03705, partial [Candidatus Caldatribacteriaceae bacterium]
MMRYSSLVGIVMIGVLVLTFSGVILAQERWGQKLTGEQESFTGTVTAVDLDAPETSLTLQIGEENIVVELGPVWNLEEFSVQVGDILTVNGEKVSEGKVVAYSISRVDANGNMVTLTLRDENGKPIWSGSTGPKEGTHYRNRNRVNLRVKN